MNDPPAAPPAPPTLAGRLRALLQRGLRVLLGLFVLWQLGWLLAANLSAVADLAADSIPHTPAAERLAEGSRQTRRVTRPWMDLTGQPQHWGLFAPDVSDQLSFPGVELVWADERKYPRCRLPSANEPESPDAFFRLGHFRLRRYETSLSLTPPPHRGPFDPARDSWPGLVAHTISESYLLVGAYLRWRLLAFRQEHPTLPPPAEVILYVHLLRIPEPPGSSPWRWQDLGQHPLARWRPYAGDPPGSQPLQIYDPVRRTFE